MCTPVILAAAWPRKPKPLRSPISITELRKLIADTLVISLVPAKVQIDVTQRVYEIWALKYMRAGYVFCSVWRVTQPFTVRHLVKTI